MGAMRQAVIAGLFVLCALACSAEPRWCTITGRGANDSFFYPPIARAARVHGVVLGRVVYTPVGKFVRFEYIFGPRLLSNMVSGQLERWTIQTHAEGDELCQTLVIAEFRLGIDGPPEPAAQVYFETGSTLRLTAVDTPYTIDTVISDPAPLRGFKLFRAEVRWKLRRIFGWMIGTH